MDKFNKFDIASTVTDSLIEVFDMMLSLELQLTDDDSTAVLGEEKIVGSIDLGGKVLGSIIIEVSKKFSRIMTASMLDVDVDDVKGKDDVKDVISELCNIVAGNLKSKFCDIGLTCELSPPSFTEGNDFAIETLNTERHEQYVFSHEQHIVIVKVGVKLVESEDRPDEQQKIQVKQVTAEMINSFDTKTYINDSMVEVFDMMLSMELKPSEKNLKSNIDGDKIAGTVSFIGLLSGSLYIHMGKDFSRQATAAMLGMEEEEIEGEGEVKDVISEICNIVGGNLKSKLCDAGLICGLSTPSITYGTDFAIEVQHIIKVHPTKAYLAS